jgi:hypothetical protein
VHHLGEGSEGWLTWSGEPLPPPQDSPRGAAQLMCVTAPRPPFNTLECDRETLPDD